MQIHGNCDERFAALRKVFAANFELGLDVGEARKYKRDSTAEFR